MRIGVVLSVLWMVGGTTYFYVDDMRHHGDIGASMYNHRQACFRENIENSLNKRPLQPCISDEEVAAAFKSKTPFWFFPIIPTFWLVTAWIVIGITYGSVRWIRNGFKA